LSKVCCVSVFVNSLHRLEIEAAVVQWWFLLIERTYLYGMFIVHFVARKDLAWKFSDVSALTLAQHLCTV